MGVYIDMEMPKSCDMCWALDDYGDYPRCRITEEQRGYNFPIREKRMDNCPLVPVPPHGDLIDKQYAYQNTMAMGEHMRKIILKQIDLLPTIIPAEEGE